MGKKANERRKRIFEELRIAGKITPPKRKIEKKPEPVVETVEIGCYCRVKYGQTLPSLFRLCPDCPDP